VNRDDGFDSFEWDEAKSDETFMQRGIDFEAAAQVFVGAYVQREDTRKNYGEPRYVVTGEVDTGITDLVTAKADTAVITVVWTPRGSSRRIISARKASRRERRDYEHSKTLD
jgi:uncharacterized DUF497 family protein